MLIPNCWNCHGTASVITACSCRLGAHVLQDSVIVQSASTPDTSRPRGTVMPCWLMMTNPGASMPSACLHTAVLGDSSAPGELDHPSLSLTVTSANTVDLSRKPYDDWMVCVGDVSRPHDSNTATPRNMKVATTSCAVASFMTGWPRCT